MPKNLAKIPKLSDRLNAIIKQIKNKNNIICDIGCDHCYIAIYAIMTGLAKLAINIDINKLPLENGIKNLKAYGVYSKTKNLINDGLKGLTFKNTIDYCIIAGMGAKTIVDIIKNKPSNVHISKYVVVCNNKPELLREYAILNNMNIDYEQIIIERTSTKKYYFFLMNISSNHTAKKILKTNINTKDIYIGKYIIDHITSESIEYFNDRYNYLRNIKNPKFNDEISDIKYLLALAS